MKKHSAFTMIELVMVIVVFGIVASIGAEIVAKLYENYLRTRAINRLESQTEIVLEQIAKRLQYRIKDSVRASENNGTSWVSLVDQTADKGYRIVEWIGISNESFLGEHNGTSVVPGWSGLIDMDSNETNGNVAVRTLKTPGSRLDFANNIIQALTNNSVALDGTAGAKRPALIFKGSKIGTFSDYYSPSLKYLNKVACKANDCNANKDIFSAPNGLADIDGDSVGDLFEQYYLSHSAYALELVSTDIITPVNPKDFNLTLRYNYQPWENEIYSNGTASVLAEHVSTFRIRQDGDTIRIKLCIHDNNQSGNFDFSACKEKAIF